jgi:hypothetical protein
MEVKGNKKERGGKKAIWTHEGRLFFFPQQQWLCECTSLLQDTYITCLIMFLDTKQEDKDPELNGSKHSPSSNCS